MTDIAQLGIAVDTSQTTLAARELDKLTAAGGRAEGATKSLGNTSRQSMAEVASASSKAAQAMERMAASQERQEKLTQQMARQMQELTGALQGNATANNAMAQAANNAAQALGQEAAASKTAQTAAQSHAQAASNAATATGTMAGQASAAGAAVGGMAAKIAAAAGALLSLNKAMQDMDAWTNMNNRIKLVTEGQDQFVQAQSNIISIANSTRQPLKETAELYQRMAGSQKALGLSGADLAGVVQTISQSMVISGTSAASGAAALMQLGQAFNSGVLRGEEFNSVMEQAPGLMQAIAAGMGKTVGEMRGLAEAGKLTAEAVVKSLQSQSSAVNENFAKMGSTIGQSGTVFNNKMTEFIGRMDDATGISKALANGVIGLSDNMGALATGVGTLVAFGLATWLGGVAAAAGGVGIAFTAAGVAAKGLLASIGPAGWLILGLGAAATAWQLMGDKAEKSGIQMDGAGNAAKAAGDKLVAGITPAIDKAIAAYDKLINKQKEALGTAASPLQDVAKGIKEADLNLQKLAQQVARAQRGGGEYVNMGPDQRAAAEKALTAELEKASKKRGELAAKEQEYNANVVTAYVKGKDRQTEASEKLLKIEEAKEKRDKALVAAGVDRAKQDAVNAAYRVEMANIEESASKKGASAIKAAAKEENQSLKERQAIYAEIADVSSDYYSKLSTAQKQLKSGDISEAMYIKYVEELIQKQPFATAQVKAATEAWKEQEKEREKSSKAVEKAYEDEVSSAEKSAKSVTDKVAQLKIEEEAQKLVTSQNIALSAAIEQVMIKRLEEQAVVAKDAGKQELLDSLTNEIAARKELAEYTGRKEDRDASSKAAKKAAEDWKSASDKISNDLTDALMRGFESGKDFAKNMRDVIVNMFKTMVLKPVISAVMQPVSGAIASAMGGGGRGGSAMQTASDLSSLWGTASQAMFGATAGATTASLVGANAVGMMGGDAIGALIAANGGWVGVATGASAAAEAAIAANLALEAGTAVALEAGTLATAAGTAGAATAGAASSITSAIAAIPGWGWALAGLALVAGSGVLDGGETRTGSRLETTAAGTRYAEGPSGGRLNASLEDKITKQTFDGINNLLKNLGSKEVLGKFVSGLETSDRGRGGVFAGGTLSSGATFGDAQNAADYKFGQDLKAEDAIKAYIGELNIVTIEALKAATDIPEYISASLAAVDVAKITDDQASQILSDVSALYSSMQSVNEFMGAVGGKVFATTKQAGQDMIDLVAGFGGLDAFKASAVEFLNVVDTPLDKPIRQYEMVMDSAKELGLQMPITATGMKSLANSLDLATESGRKQYTSLLKLAPQYAAAGEAMLQSLGTSTEQMAGVIEDGLRTGNYREAGQQLANTVVNGIYDSIYGGTATLIAQTFTNSIITPMIVSMNNGSTAAEALAGIDLSGAQNQITGFISAVNALTADKGFTDFIGNIAGALGGDASKLPKQNVAQNAAAASATSGSSGGGADSPAEKAVSEVEKVMNDLAGAIKGFADDMKGPIAQAKDRIQEWKDKLQEATEKDAGGSGRASRVSSIAAMVSQKQYGDAIASQFSENLRTGVFEKIGKSLAENGYILGDQTDAFIAEISAGPSALERAIAQGGATKGVYGQANKTLREFVEGFVTPIQKLAATIPSTAAEFDNLIASATAMGEVGLANELASMRDSAEASGNSASIARLAELELAKARAEAYDALMAPTEVANRKFAELADRFGDIGAVMPKSIQQLRSMVDAAQAMGNTDLADQLMDLGGAFGKVNSKLQGLNDEGFALTAELARALGNEEGALGIERKAAISGMTQLEVAQYDANQSTRTLIAGVQGLSSTFDSAVAALATPEQKLGMGYAKALSTLSGADINITAEQAQAYTSAQILEFIGSVSQMGDVSAETRTKVIGAAQAIAELNAQALDMLIARIEKELDTRIAAWQKELNVAQERAGIEQTALQLIGKTTELRKRELETLDATNRALQERVYAVQDASDGVDKALALVQRSVDAEKTAISKTTQAQIDAINAGADGRSKAIEAAKKSISDLTGIFDDVANAVKTLRQQVVPEAMQMAQARAYISMALSVAQAGGQVNSDRLKESLAVVTKDTADTYATGAEFRFTQAKQANELDRLGGVMGDQKDKAQAALDAAEKSVTLAADQIKAIEKARDDQIAALDAQLKTAQDSVSVMRGVDISVIGVDESVQALNRAMASYEAARDALAHEQLTAGQDAINRLDAMMVADKENTDRLITSMQQWAAATTAAAQQQAQASIAAAQASAAAAIAQATAAAQQTVVGGAMLPSFDIGTNYVPRDMVAQIHEGEAVVPKAFNPAAFGGSSGSSDLAPLVLSLTAEVQRLQGIVQAGNIEQRRTANAVNGQPEAPMLVETV